MTLQVTLPRIQTRKLVRRYLKEVRSRQRKHSEFIVDLHQLVSFWNQPEPPHEFVNDDPESSKLYICQDVYDPKISYGTDTIDRLNEFGLTDLGEDFIDNRISMDVNQIKLRTPIAHAMRTLGANVLRGSVCGDD